MPEPKCLDVLSPAVTSHEAPAVMSPVDEPIEKPVGPRHLRTRSRRRSRRLHGSSDLPDSRPPIPLSPSSVPALNPVMDPDPNDSPVVAVDPETPQPVSSAAGSPKEPLVKPLGTSPVESAYEPPASPNGDPSSAAATPAPSIPVSTCQPDRLSPEPVLPALELTPELSLSPGLPSHGRDFPDYRPPVPPSSCSVAFDSPYLPLVLDLDPVKDSAHKTNSETPEPTTVQLVSVLELHRPSPLDFRPPSPVPKSSSSPSCLR